MSNVFYLPGKPTPVARFLRVNEHRPLEQFLEAGKLPFERFVVEAGYFAEQRDLINALKQRGHELVLDTNVANEAVGECKPSRSDERCARQSREDKQFIDSMSSVPICDHD